MAAAELPSAGPPVRTSGRRDGSQSRTAVRVQLVTSSPLIGAGLARVLEGFRDRVALVGAADDEGQVDAVDVVLVDLVSSAGPATADELATAQRSGTGVVVLVAPGAGAGHQGPVGLVDLHTTPQGLVDALEQAGAERGSSAWTGDPTGVAGDARDDVLQDAEQTARLSERELDVLHLIGTNHSNSEIATTLYLSPNTVKTYIRSAYHKIGVTTRTGAVLWALRHGLVVDRSDES